MDGTEDDRADVVTSGFVAMVADDPRVVVIYAYGIVACSVCAPSTMEKSELEATVNLLAPTGISSAWHLSDDPEWATGGPQPSPCGVMPEVRTHYLLQC